MTAKYTGELRRGAEPDTIVGSIKDEWGWAIQIVGTRQPDGSYVLDGTLGDVPPALLVPLIDGAKA